MIDGTSDYSSQYKGLVENSDLLNIETIALQHHFSEIEEKLSDICLFVTAWAEDLIGVMQSKQIAYKFGYCKLRGRWQFVCKRVDLDEQGEYNRAVFERKGLSLGLLQPIGTMPRQIQCEAAELMPNLLMQLQRASGKIVGSVQLAIDNLKETKQILDAITPDREKTE